MSVPPLLVVIASLLALVLASGCGKKESAKVATQVVARVNGDEITVHQVNFILARSPNVAPDAAAQAKREILDKLINQLLAKQKAIEKELDRSPKVLQAVEEAKSEILARAYLERIVVVAPKPTRSDTNLYYLQHPELFAKRRLFELEELIFEAKGDVAAELREQMSKARSIQEIAGLLQSRGVRFVANRGVRAAEQIPLEILPALHAMKEGEIRLFGLPGGRFQAIRVVTSRADPVDEETATPRIQQFLFNRRSSEVIAAEMKQLREQAKIEYVGEFADGTAAAQSKVKAEADAQPRSEDSPKVQPRK